MKRFSRFALALAIASAWSEPASADPKTEAREHFQRAVAFADQGAFEEALVEFQRAYEIQPHPSVLYNIAQTQAASGHPLEAADAFEKYLHDAGNSITAKRRAEVQRELDQQLERIGRLTIDVRPSGATIRVDGREIGQAPLAEPVRVRLGTHHLEIALAGYESAEREVKVAGREQVTIQLELHALQPSGASLSVDCAPPNVAIEIDGKLAAMTPAPGSLRLKAGSHRIAFRREGYKTDSHRLNLAEGGEARIRCQLEPLERSPAKSMADRGADRHSGAERWRFWAWVAGGTGAALGLAAVGVYAWNDGRHTDWERERDALDSEAQKGPPFSASYSQRQAENDDLLDSIKRWDRIDLGVGIAGGALLTTGVILFVIGESPSKSAQSVGFAPVTGGSVIGWSTRW